LPRQVPPLSWKGWPLNSPKKNSGRLALNQRTWDRLYSCPSVRSESAAGTKISGVTPAATATKETLFGAAKAVREFERIYLRKEEYYQWIDDRDLLFGRNGPRHAEAPFPRGWKFSYRLPDGFHYDIKHLEERKFSITDVAGTLHTTAAKGYINMDPHGYVRG
jgi:hypothetical protein